MSATPHKIGRYEVREEIGRGAMGVVYRARDPIIGRDVAIKVLRRDGILASDQASTFAMSLRNETRLAMRLSHPNILRVFHFEQSGGWEYVVMELATGENLHQVVQRRTGRPRRQIEELALVVEQGLLRRLLLGVAAVEPRHRGVLEQVLRGRAQHRRRQRGVERRQGRQQLSGNGRRSAVGARRDFGNLGPGRSQVAQVQPVGGVQWL